MNYFDLGIISRSRKFLLSNTRSGEDVSGHPTLIVYHGDGDGCTSAYFMKKVLKKHVIPYWVATPDFDFEEAERFALERCPALIVFLDLPVYNRPAMIQKLADGGAHVFIYDHHYSGRNFRFSPERENVLYVNPLGTSGSGAYPTSLFCWELLPEKGLFEKQVLYMGLYTETWLDRLPLFSEFSPSLLENLKEIARGIHASFLLEEDGTAHRALELLLRLSEDAPSLDVLLHEVPGFHALAEFHAFAQKEKLSLMKGVEAVIRKLHRHELIISGIDSKSRLCGLIASDLRWSNPGSVIGIWQRWKDRLICELRRGTECRVNLALLVERINSDVPLLTGGGHPEAAAFAAVENRFFVALRKMRDLVAQGFLE